VHVVRIGERNLVVVPAVAGVVDDVASAGGDGLKGMRLENPVADVDDMDVLLDQNVTGEIAIPEPVADALLVCGGAGVIVLDGGRRVVIRGDGGDFSRSPLWMRRTISTKGGALRI
jgi:hypothetical protein